MNLKKLASNYIVIMVTGLPNLAITFGTLSIFTLVFHWAGLLSLLAYLIGQGFSVSYSVAWNILTKSNFQVGRWHWHFELEPKAGASAQGLKKQEDSK
jgi:hypothetical protein